MFATFKSKFKILKKYKDIEVRIMNESTNKIKSVQVLCKKKDEI